MPQLSTSKTDAKPAQLSPKDQPNGKPNGDTNGKQSARPPKAGEWTKLGYEVFNKRRLPYVQVPLSVSNAAASSSPTGSALLDSFVRDRKIEPPALQTLRLINVADSLASKVPNSETAIPEAATPEAATQQNSANNLLNRTATADPAAGPSTKIQSLADEPTALELEDSDSRASQSDAASEPSFEPISETASETVSEGLEAEGLEVSELLVTLKEPDLQEPDLQEPDLQEPNSKTLSAAPGQAPQALSDQPPSEAEPAQLDAAPVPRPSAPQSKQRSPQLPRAVSASRPGPPAVNHEKRARDSAASVGLIDVTDTLLFGGDRPDLVSADPFIPTDNEAATPGVLSYLTKQISAFTVDKLQSGFPHNTDPRVLHRIDPPKRRTVLDIENFKLGKLSNLKGQQQPRELPPQPSTSVQDAADIQMLSQQVEDLNRKIAHLSQKLSQVSDAAE